MLTSIMLTSALFLLAQDAPPESPHQSEGPRSESIMRSVEQGLIALADMQVEDGSFGTGRYAQHAGVSAVAGMAFMSNGSLCDRGRWAPQVRSVVDFLLGHVQPSGLIAAETSHGPMYGHGFATLLLAEIYGSSHRDDDVREALARAIDLIVRTQNEEGGWRYQPVPADADVSVTICQVMALRSARTAGIAVPRETIDRAVAYVKRCQNPDGGFRYMLREGPAAWPRTAAGVATLYYAGIYEDEAIEQGLDWLMANAMPGKGTARQSHWFYGQYYAAQAMYQAGGDRWKNWWPAAQQTLLSRQSSNGAWVDPHVGTAYGTAMALISLQLPEGLLPIMQR
ncbi:MAG: terpene cyclase/mutase family protein [Phycisphaerales bacterium]|nr:terpene cyclase/mutase family protein [Phycisphaerales bacterium]